MSYTKNQLTNLSDSELVVGYKKTNDKNYVGELYKRYTHLVLGMCISYLKDYERGQDEVLIIFEKLFDELKISNVTNFKNWLGTVVYRHCMNEIRNEKRKVGRAMKYQNEVSHTNSFSKDEDEECSYFSNQGVENLMNALKELKYLQKICVELFYLKKMSYAEVAEATGLSTDKVKSHIQNGKRNLKLILTNNK